MENCNQLRLEEKLWGREINLLKSEKIGFKRLELKHGARLGLEYRRLAVKYIYVEQGQIALFLEDGSEELRESRHSQGAMLAIPPKRRHQITALAESVLFQLVLPYEEDLIEPGL